MAGMIRSADWSKSPLGPVTSWSPTLLSTVNMMLSAPIPMQLFWGPEFVVLYNDPLIPVMTGKHPGALGMLAQECWAEAWSIVGPQMEKVFQTGLPLFFKETIVPINLDGKLEEVYWDYSYSPCFGPDGAVEGVIDIAQDVTESVRARESLRASEARARRVLQSIGDAVIVTDADARVTIFNPVAEELTGWTESEAQGHELRDVFPIINEETRLTVENPADKVRRLGQTVGLANHTILVNRNGQEVHIDDSAAPVRGEDGSLQGIVLVFRDIDERRTAERERDAISARLNQVLDDTNDSIFTVNRDWVITYMNPMAKKVSYPLVDVVGKNFWEAYPHAQYEGSPYVEHYYRAMDEHVAGSFEAYYPEPINVWVAVAVMPSSEGITIYFTDVTQRKRDAASLTKSEAHALESEAQLQLIMDALPSYLSYVDRDFRYVRVNKTYEEWFGLSAIDIVGRRVPEVVGEEAAATIQTAFDMALEGSGQHFVYSIRTHDKERVLRVPHIPDTDPWGNVRGVIIQGEDITDQKKAEEALIRSEKLAAVGRLAASIAHEINNPLESVTNLLYLARSSDEVAEIQKYLDTAERELRRVSVISNQTLRFYKQSTKPTAVTANDLLESVLSIYQGRLVNSRVEVERSDRTTREVECFEGEIRQVLNNLVGNAIDALHPTGGRLLLRSRNGFSWRRDQQGIFFTIADTGPGMPDLVKKRIFEAFYTTKGIGGTGLGLWVSKEIVERHHGSLRVRSSTKEEAHGTVFRLFLPVDAVTR